MSKKERGGHKDDPMEIMLRKFRAKCKFRACVRLVQANAHWLAEDLDEYEGFDVKRRVEQAKQASKKKKQLLSVKDKALLNKPAEDRTDSEKKYIYRLIGGLKCFKRYPKHVQKKLAAVTMFQYFGPGRVIMREKQEGLALYFVVSGSIRFTHSVFDEVLQKNIDMEIAIMHTGDMFGEISLLHNIPRQATATTIDHCELLVLPKDHFQNILLVSVQRQWDEVLQAMSKFTYFDCFDAHALREGCIVAKMKKFKPQEIILGDGCGIANYVHFLLTGRCLMIENLSVLVKQHMGKTTYTLHDPYEPDAEKPQEDFKKKWVTDYHPKKPESEEFSKPKSSTSMTSTVQERKTHSSILKNQSRSSIKQSLDKTGSVAKVKVSEDVIQEKETRRRASQLSSKKTSVVGSQGSKTGLSKTSLERETSSKQKLDAITESEPSRAVTESDRSKTFLPPVFQERRSSTRINVMDPVYHLQTYYMEVCKYNVGASFGFGENMRDRRIVALTEVECMMIPKVWLLQRNTANIWTRIQYYLEKKIPDKKKLFKIFLDQRKWEYYRVMLVQDVLRNATTINYTSVHDVPYSVRLEEMLDV